MLPELERRGRAQTLKQLSSKSISMYVEKDIYIFLL